MFVCNFSWGWRNTGFVFLVSVRANKTPVHQQLFSKYGLKIILVYVNLYFFSLLGLHKDEFLWKRTKIYLVESALFLHGANICTKTVRSKTTHFFLLMGSFFFKTAGEILFFFSKSAFEDVRFSKSTCLRVNSSSQLWKKGGALAFFASCLCEEAPSAPSEADSCGLLSALNILFAPKTARTRSSRECAGFSPMWNLFICLALANTSVPLQRRARSPLTAGPSVLRDASTKINFLRIHPS